MLITPRLRLARLAAAVALAALPVEMDAGAATREDIPVPEARPGDAGPKPTPQHAILARSIGSWTARIEIRSPGEPPRISRAVETATMECGGLWLVTEIEGEIGGAPYHGRGTYGYDPARGKYLGMWVDSTATYPWLSEGDFDESTNSLTMLMEGPGADGQMERWRTVTRFVDDRHRTFTMYQSLPDGKEAPGLIIRYTRRP